MSKARDLADIASDDVIATTASGVDVTGTITSDGLTVDGGTIKLDGNYPVGTNNVALGNEVFFSLTSGSDNTAVGRASMYDNASGSYNTALGANSLANNTTPSGNTAVGYQAGYSNVAAGAQVFVGYKAGYATTTGGGSSTFVGYEAGLSNTTGSSNTAVGRGVFLDNTTGSDNVAIGHDALANNTTGSYSTAVGYQAGYSSTTVNSNALFGYYAGQQTTGGENTFIGTSCGYAVTTGSKNTIIGRYNGNQNGLDIRTSSNNIVLSDGDGNPFFAICGVSQGAGTRIIGGNSWGKFWKKSVKVGVNGTVDLLNVAHYPGNNRVYVKVSVMAVSAVADTSRAGRAYARINANGPSSGLASGTAYDNGAGIEWSVFWSGGTLKLLTANTPNYTGFLIEVEYTQHDGNSDITVYDNFQTFT